MHASSPVIRSLVATGLCSLLLGSSLALGSDVFAATEVEECPVVLTRKSPEFKAAASGFVKVLTQLARKHHRRFHKAGAPKAFFLEMVECLPEAMQEDARRAVLDAELMDSDADNADVNATAVSRLLTAFRGLVMAWNAHSPSLISLENLHEFDGATLAIETMGLSAALTERYRRRELEAFRNHDTGALPVLKRLALQVRISFGRNARAIFEILWSKLPADSDETLREDARIAIAAILDQDGQDVTRTDTAANRILQAWRSLAAAYGHVTDVTLGIETTRILESIKAVDLLEPQAARFAGRSKGFQYVQRVVHAVKGTRAKRSTIRDFLFETAATFLPSDALAQFGDLLDAMGWVARKKTSSPTPTASTKMTRQPRKTNGAVEEDRPENLATPFGQTAFAGLLLLVDAWNRFHAGSPEKQISVEGLHSPTAIFRAFRMMALEVPEPPPEETEALLPTPSASEESISISEAETPEPENEVLEPEPVEAVVHTPAVVTAAPILPDGLGRIDEFRSASGGLAYVRGVMRQFGRNFESPHYVRDFLLERARSLKSPFREKVINELLHLPWSSADSITAFSDRTVAARVLGAFEVFATAWNESTAGEMPVTIDVVSLSTARGMYHALMWWGVGGLDLDALAERPGSGFIFAGEPSRVYAVFAPPRPTAPPSIATPVPRPPLPKPPPPPTPKPTPTPKPPPKPKATPIAKPVPQPRPEPEPELVLQPEEKAPVDPLFALRTLDPAEPEGLVGILTLLRQLHSHDAPAATVTAMLGVVANTTEVPRTAYFRASVLKTLWFLAPKGDEQIAQVIRRGLASKEPEIFSAAGDGVVHYMEGGGSREFTLVQRIARENGPVRQLAVTLLQRLQPSSRD